MAHVQDLTASVARRHEAIFYDTDPELVAALAPFVTEGLLLDERVIAVATAAHRAALSARLIGEGVDVETAERAGRLVLLDARTVLDSFLVADSPDPERFRTTVGALVPAATEQSGTRVFGEMVALLWDDGLVGAALELESLWNELGHELDFSLLCGYRTTSIEGSPLPDVRDVCTAHTSLRPPARYAAGPPPQDGLAESPSWLFLPVPEAVASARRFVTGVLELRGEPALLDDAVLIVSELATNAVRHAASPFRLSLDRSVGTVRIAIQDVVDDGAEEQEPRDDAIGGRGLAIVGALTQCWGTDALPTGKVVWAQLDATPESRAS